MKSYLLIVFFLNLSVCTLCAQISLNYLPNNRINFNTLSQLERNNFQSIGISIGGIVKDKYISKLELFFKSPIQSSENKTEKYFGINYFCMGYMINNGNRIQFPLMASIGFETYKSENIERLGGLNLGIQTGIRFYLTNRICVQALYEVRSVARKFNIGTLKIGAGYMIFNRAELNE